MLGLRGMGEGVELRVRKKDMKPRRQTRAEKTMYVRDILKEILSMPVKEKRM